jgi:hypothetical protein
VAPVTPTATSQPKAACSPITCALAQGDVILQAGVWLLLLLLVMALTAAIVMVRARLLRGRKATMEKEEMLSAPTAGDAATLGDLATADDIAFDSQDKPPADPLATTPDDLEQVSPLDAPTQPSSNDVSGAPEAMREAAPGNTTDTTDMTSDAADAADAAGEAPAGEHEATSNLDIPAD